jgi:hypothetical protein
MHMTIQRGFAERHVESTACQLPRQRSSEHAAVEGYLWKSTIGQQTDS